jgi:hypothetical protein
MTRTIVLLVAATTLPVIGGCGSSVVTAPTPLASSTELAVFLDRETGFSTNDVYDAQDQTMRFNATGDLVWAATGERFGGFIADGHVITADRICAGCYFLVQFGRSKGEERAYLTWAAEPSAEHAAAVLDVEIVGTHLSVTASDRLVPYD